MYQDMSGFWIDGFSVYLSIFISPNFVLRLAYATFRLINKLSFLKHFSPSEASNFKSNIKN